MNRPLAVGIIGDCDPAYPSHAATEAALRHAAASLGLAVEPAWLPTPSLESADSGVLLEPCAALWCAPGSPYRSMDGALRAIRFARERGRPFIGT